MTTTELDQIEAALEIEMKSRDGEIHEITCPVCNIHIDGMADTPITETQVAEMSTQLLKERGTFDDGNDDECDELRGEVIHQLHD